MDVDNESFSPLHLYYLAGIGHRVADGQGGCVASCGGRPPSLSSLAFSTFPLLHHFSYLVFPAPLHRSCLSVGVTSHPASAVSLSPSPPPRGFPSNQSSDRNVIIGLMVYFIPQSLFELTAVILGHNKLNYSKINFEYECRTSQAVWESQPLLSCVQQQSSQGAW